MTVLSKFCILTVVSVTSVTYPSAPYLLMVIQSPGRSMSFAESCTPATSPRIVSLNMSISMAAEAPRPVSMAEASLSMSMLIMMIMPTAAAMRLTIW